MQKKIVDFQFWRAVWPEVLLLLAAAVTFAFVLVAPLAFAEGLPLTVEEARLWDAYTRGELIRLHVLADSDGAEAQRVKLAVRDALLGAFGQELAAAGTQDCDAVYALLQDSAGAMREVAQRCAKENGFNGPVTAEVGRMLLPAKVYGHVTLPEGEYRALRVTLGSGKGQNWWCVLFPQLCLAVAEDEPWQTQSGGKEPVATDGGGTATTADTPNIVWDSGRILHCWTAMAV